MHASILHFCTKANTMLEARPITCDTPIVTSYGVPSLKGCGARDALLETSKIWVFKEVKTILTQ